MWYGADADDNAQASVIDLILRAWQSPTHMVSTTANGAALALLVMGVDAAAAAAPFVVIPTMGQAPLAPP